jgi:predicted GH43/DUF377 family glycosyl hydrolase
MRSRWASPYQVLRPNGPGSELERHRSWRPSALEEPGATRRMWYSADDGVTTRIVHAVEPLEFGWTRQGACLAPGLAGDTDAAGVEAPSVVRGRHGYLMAYSGSDGTVTRTHLATSLDGRHWRPWGAVPIDGGHGEGARTPCLVMAGGRLHLYQSAPGDDGRAAIHHAVPIGDGAWSALGVALAPGDGERAVTAPWVLAEPDGWAMFLVVHDSIGDTTIQLAVSPDGVSWERRPAPLDVHRRHYDRGRLDHPTAVRLRSGALRLFYAASPEDDDTGGCRLWFTDLLPGVPIFGEGAPRPERPVAL